MTMHPKRDVVIVINPGSTSSEIRLYLRLVKWSPNAHLTTP